MNLTKEEEELIAKLHDHNPKQYNALKLAEELNELAVELMQVYTKPNKNNLVGLTDELGDVILRLRMFIPKDGETAIKARIKHKLDKYARYLKENRYPTI